MSKPDPGAGRFDIDSQRAESISNVARDQYVYQVRRAPDLGRPSRTGPWTMGAGGMLFLVGSGIWGYAVLSSVLQVFTLVGQPSGGTEVPAFPGFDFHTGLLALGGAFAFAGTVVFFIGLFLTVVTWRRRRAPR